MNRYIQVIEPAADITTAILFALVISAVSFKLRFLTLSGAAATFILAVLIYGFGGWMWTIPMLTFFILSSILSKLRKNRNREVESFFDKTGKRDYMQVIANGGIGGILVILFWLNPSELLYIIYVSIIAAVCADTWGTEWGTYFKQKTYSIINCKEVRQGISGGVSLAGLTGVITGSIIIALSTFYWVNSNYLLYICIIVIAGFTGSIIDSIAGGTIQAQHKCKKCSQITERREHCGEQTERYRGISGLTNDMVNIICGVTGGITGFILYELFQV